MKKNKILLFGGVAVLAWVVTKPLRVLQNISYNFSKLKLSDITVQNTVISLIMDIKNGNSQAVNIQELKGQVFFGNQAIGEVQPVSFTLPPAGNLPVAINFQLQNFTILGFLGNIIASGNYGQLLNSFYIKWTVGTQWGTFPYSQKIGVEL